MPYRTFARLHLGGSHALARLREDRAQGTVEYVGLVILMAAVITAVAAVGNKAGGVAQIPTTIVGELQDAIEGVGGKGK